MAASPPRKSKPRRVPVSHPKPRASSTARAAPPDGADRSADLFSNDFVAVYRSRIDGSAMLAVNQRMCDLFGTTREELLARPALMRWADPERRNEMLRRLQERGELRDFELDILTVDGERRTVMTSVRAYPDKGWLEGASVDITDRKRIERTLRESEEHFRAAFEHANIGRALSSVPDGRFVRVNRPMCRMLGYEAAELESMTFGQVTHPDDLDRSREAVREVFEGKVEALSFEKRYLRKDGTILWGAVNLTLLRDAAGRPTHFNVDLQDVTAKKQAEAELRQTLSDLERSNEELEQFAYVASHDLQEPLRMVASYVQLLQRRYQGKLDRDADDFIGFAVDGAQRMKRLINDLLAFSRVGTRGGPPARVSAQAALDAAKANLQAAIEETATELTSDPLPVVAADPTQLAQLFQNLLDNAIKFRGAEPPRIRITVERRNDEWLFAVRDNGIGIAPEHFKRLFIVFQRLHGRDEYPGTGIGLAICRKIVERHGGRITVGSEPGKGSVFRFTLPAERAGRPGGGTP